MSAPRRCSCAAALVAILCCTGVAGASSEPSATAIEANVDAASGVRPVAERITSTIVKNGRTGIEVRIRSGDDFRIDTRFGPLSTAQGMYAGVSWKQNANGETVVNAGDPAEPVSEPVTTSVAHLRGPFERYVVSSLNGLGNGTREVVDASTWRVIETDRITSTETTVTRYSDFTRKLGCVRAWRQTSSDGYAENAVTSTIESDVATAIPQQMLAVPKSRRTVVEFRSGAIAHLPARLTPHGDRFIVRLTVGTRGLDFLLDSGAGGISLDRDVARSLGLREVDTFSNADSAGRYTGGEVVVPKMAIGDLTLHDVVMSTIPHAGSDSSGVRIVGLLGFDFLAGVVAKLDYVHGSVTVFDPRVFQVPVRRNTMALAVRLGQYVPEVSAAINGRTGARFILDTAGVGAALIVDYFQRKYPGAAVDEYDSPDTQRLTGIGGAFDVTQMQIAALQLGSTTFRDRSVFVIDSPRIYGGDFDGIIGPDILRQFTIFVDLGRGHVYLDPR